MNTYAVYDISTGGIDRIYSGAAWEALLQAQPGEGVVVIAENLNDATAYIDVSTTQPTVKQPFTFTITKTQITADGIDKCIITGIPLGTTLTHGGEFYEIMDGIVEFQTDLAATYTLTFTAVPYLDQEVIIEAVAAT
jgi:hypothetical protein